MFPIYDNTIYRITSRVKLIIQLWLHVKTMVLIDNFIYLNIPTILCSLYRLSFFNIIYYLIFKVNIISVLIITKNKILYYLYTIRIS